MNIRETEEKLRTACEHAAPDDLEAIKKRLENAQAGDELVPVSFEAEKKKDIHTRQLRRICTGVAAAAVCLLALLPFIGNKKAEEADPSGKLAAGNEGTVQVQLESNPDIELTINADGRVVAIKTLTADAKAVMEKLDMDLEGADVKVAENAIIGAMLKQNGVTVSADTVQENTKDSVSAPHVSANKADTVKAADEEKTEDNKVAKQEEASEKSKKNKDKDKKKTKGKEASENMTGVSENGAAVSENKEVLSESSAAVSESKTAVSESKTAVSESKTAVSGSNAAVSESGEAFSGSKEAAFMAALIDAGLTADDVTKYEVTAVTEDSLSANSGVSSESVSKNGLSKNSVSGAGALKTEKSDEIMGYLVKIVAGKYTYAYTIDIKGVVISSLKIISG
ncbi:MAG: hypothetical protein K5987_04770 [Lachnospiraceae bacterium]|nr:hypothetical protein [Lachnospiraceae bacterium]